MKATVFTAALMCLAAPGAYSRIVARHEDREVFTPPASQSYCSDPVAKAKVEFPESLLGRAAGADGLNYDMYSGYVNVTTAPDYLYYWFFEADMDEAAAADAPLIVWTNGGPGCSAMEGATTENGPLVLYRIKESYDLATGQLSSNPYAWNKLGHVLYVDQPRYVGNSFGYGDQVLTSEDAGKDIVTFLQGWYELYPEHASRDVIISGESYGGHYVPAWTSAIMSHNEAVGEDSVEIPLKGVAIGNGCVNDTVQGTQPLVDFLKENDLIPASANPKNQVTAQLEMKAHIGYDPNFYDFRVQNVQCAACYSYNYTEWSYWFLRDDVKEALNICGDAGEDAFAGNAGGCISLPGFDREDTFDYSAALARALDAGIDVTFYYGKNDLACNYKGGYDLASTLEWKGADAWNAAPLKQVPGAQVQSSGGLSWHQVDGAGHMVPLDQPSNAYNAIGELVSAATSRRQGGSN